MSKALKTVAIVVGVAAIVVATAGIGAAPALSVTTTIGGVTATSAVAATSAGIFGLSAATLGTIASGLSLASGLTAKKPVVSSTVSGTQIDWKADTTAGLPYPIGRTLVGGNIVFRSDEDGYSDKINNDLQTVVTVLGAGGPMQEIETYLADGVPVAFTTDGEAVGSYSSWMWQRVQLGQTPEPAALNIPVGASSMPEGWTAAHRLSGYAASMIRLRFDADGKQFQSGIPKAGWVGKWTKVYDPRLDSTYPGGSGACRAGVESTYVWSENPFLHGLTWCLGRFQNGVRILGVGAPAAAIDVAAFVEGANVADANGWKVGGVVLSSDRKWEVLKAMLQAGAGEPLQLGARISCWVNAPRVSLDTITVNDIAGEVSIAGTQSRRDRINSVIATYRSEEHNWEQVPTAPITVPAYVSEDRGLRTRPATYALVQQIDQAATLARYEIENSREFGPLTLPVKTRWWGYKPGDCVDVNLPEGGLQGRQVMLLKRSLDPATGIVTFTARSETSAKHPFALGQTTTAPPTPGLQPPPVPVRPGADAWRMEIDQSTMVVTGAVDSASADLVLFEFREARDGQDVDDDWIGTGSEPPSVRRKDIPGMLPGRYYEASVRYRRRNFFGERLILAPQRAVVPRPDDVARFAAEIVGDTMHLSWQPQVGSWLSHYVIKWQPALGGAQWATSVTVRAMVPIAASGIAVPARTGTWSIKAVNIDGAESVSAAFVESDVLSLGSVNFVETLTEGPVFGGTADNVVIDIDGLMLASSSDVDSWYDVDAIADWDSGDEQTVFAPEGLYEFASGIDLGAVYTSRLVASLDAMGLDIRSDIDLVADIDALTDFDGVDPTSWNAELLVAASQDGTAFGSWSPLIIGDYTARAFRFAIRLTSRDPYVTPWITSASVSVDMPERTMGASDIECPSGGMTITFANAFRATPAVGITAQELTSGDTWKVTAKTRGSFHIQFLNASGVGVARTFDWMAKGYGVES